MCNCMPKEQEEYIEKIQKDCLESTNMTESEAYAFAFRCWQLDYVKKGRMTDKEVDVLIEHIFDNDYGYICDYMCCYHNEFCKKNCEKYITLNRECVREYARLKAKESEEC